MATPMVNVNDGKHKLIVAEEGERVLTPEQNRKYEMGHPNARKAPMHAQVYDDGGAVNPDASVDAQNSQTQQSAPKDPAKAVSNQRAAAVANMPDQGHVDTTTSPLLNQEAFD